MTRVLTAPLIRKSGVMCTTLDAAGAAVVARAPDLVRTGSHRDAAAAQRLAPSPPGDTLGPDNAQKVRLVSSVASGVAHDLGNLLSVMACNLELLASEPLSLDGAEAVRSLNAETTYLRELARELQAVTTGSEAVSSDHQTRLVAWWPGMHMLLSAVHGEDVILRAHIPRGLPAVCIETRHLTQAVLNIVGNAAHAIAEREPGDNGAGHPAAALHRGEVEISARLARGGRVVNLTITDNGPGMSLAVLARACEPLFTTRTGRGGTGLGLAMVRRLVDDAGGCLRISSAVGLGTSVTIELPIRGIRAPRAGA